MAQRTVIVTGCSFKKKGIDGDYEWMEKQPAHRDSLFIIGENFIDSLREDADAGGGTACLRPKTLDYSSPEALKRRPRAVGIPTGWSTETQGFPFMDKLYIKRAIDLSVERVVCVLDTWPEIKRVVFSCDDQDSSLIGTGIFRNTLHADVIRYISDKIINLPSHPPAKLSLERIRSKELELLPFALALDEVERLRKEVARLKKKSSPVQPRAVAQPRPGASRLTTGRQTVLFTGAKRPFSWL